MKKVKLNAMIDQQQQQQQRKNLEINSIVWTSNWSASTRFPYTKKKKLNHHQPAESAFFMSLTQRTNHNYLTLVCREQLLAFPVRAYNVQKIFRQLAVNGIVSALVCPLCGVFCCLCIWFGIEYKSLCSAECDVHQVNHVHSYTFISLGLPIM